MTLHRITAVIAGFAVVLLAVGLGKPANAQALVDSYTAVIGTEDRRNSRGEALGSVAGFLIQDRANFHRFGLRHPGDTADVTFTTLEMRQTITDLLARGAISAAARDALARNVQVPLRVEVTQTDRGVRAMWVTLMSEAPAISPPSLTFADGAHDRRLGTDATQADTGIAGPSGASLEAASPGVGTDTDGLQLTGVDEIGRHLAMWVFAQRPELMENGNRPRMLRGAQMPPGVPDYQRTGDQSVDDARHREAIMARAPLFDIPERITVDLPVRIRRSDPARPFALELAQGTTPYVNFGLDPTVPEAVRQLHVPIAYDLGVARLRDADPIRLVLPDGLVEMLGADPQHAGDIQAFRQQVLVLRATFEITTAQFTLPLTQASSNASGIPTIDMNARMTGADLMVSEGGYAGLQDATILVRYSRSDVGQDSAPAQGLDAFAARFASGMRDGRVYAHSTAFALAAGLSTSVTAGQTDIPQGVTDGTLLLTTAAILQRFPDRALADDVAARLAMRLMDPLERERHLPLGFEAEPRFSNMDELTWTLAIREAEPAIRAHILSLAPELPILVQSTGLIGIGDYDIDAEAFEIFPQNVTLVHDGMVGASPARFAVADGLRQMPMPIAEAQALLQELSADAVPNRQARAELRYSIAAATVRSGTTRTGPITENEIREAGLDIVLESFEIHTGFEGGRLLFRHDYPGAAGASTGAAGAGVEPLPDAVFDTTEVAAWAAFAAFVNNPDVLVRYARFSGGVAERDIPSMVASAPDVLWLAAVVRLGDYDETRGGYPLERIRIEGPPSIGGMVSGLPPIRIWGGDQGFVPADATTRDTIETLRDGPDIVSLARFPVSQRASDREVELVLDLPTEILFGPRHSASWIGHVAARVMPVSYLEAPAPVTPTAPLPEGLAPLPPEVAAANLLSVWAAYSERNGNAEEFLSILASREMELHADRGRAILADPPDTLWMGVSFRLGPHDPARGGFRILTLDLFPVPAQASRLPILAPELSLDRTGWTVLPAEGQDVAIIEALMANGQVRGVGEFTVQGDPAAPTGRLQLAPPATLLIGPRDNATHIQGVAMRAEWPRLGRVTASDTADLAPRASAGMPPVTPPDALLLDAEGVDLLALSLDPALYDDAAFRRMFVERLALERWSTRMGRAPAWGAFFSDPGAPLTAEGMAMLLPDFTAWTQARVARLPGTLVLPLSIDAHPAHDCRVGRMYHSWWPEGRRATEVLTGLSPATTRAALTGTRAPLSSSDVALPVPRAVGILGRPSLPGPVTRGRAVCDFVDVTTRGSDLHPERTDFDPASSPYVDAIVIADLPPALSTVPGGPAAVNYTLARPEIRLQPVAPATGDAAGLRGVIVIEAGVSEMQSFHRQGTGFVADAAVPASAWESLSAPQGDTTRDILGMTLGSPLETLLSVAEERVPGAERFETGPTADRAVFDHAVILGQVSDAEQFALVYEPYVEGQPVTAIMRAVRFAPGTASLAAVEAALLDKYGPPLQRVEENLRWGGPDPSLDSAGICGSHRVFRGTEVPDIVRQGQTDPVRGGDWSAMGWPDGMGDPDDVFRLRAEPHCGEVVLARVRETSGGGVVLTVWLLDKPAAERLLADSTPPAAVMELELDL